MFLAFLSYEQFSFISWRHFLKFYFCRFDLIGGWFNSDGRVLAEIKKLTLLWEEQIRGEMGKVSPKERESKNSKRKKRLRNSSNKYLKPGTLAQLRYSKVATAARSCTDLGKKRVAVLEAKKSDNDLLLEDNRVIDRSPLMLSPVNLVKQNSFMGTPKTPRIEDCDSDSRLESLPMDLLVFLTYPIVRIHLFPYNCVFLNNISLDF